MKDTLNIASLMLLALVGGTSSHLCADYETIPAQYEYRNNNYLDYSAPTPPPPATYPAPYHASGNRAIYPSAPVNNVYAIPPSSAPVPVTQSPMSSPYAVPGTPINTLASPQLIPVNSPARDCPSPYMPPGNMCLMTSPMFPGQDGMPCYPESGYPACAQGSDEYVCPPWLCYQNPLDAGVPLVTAKPRFENWSIYGAVLYWRAFVQDLGCDCVPVSVIESHVHTGATTEVVSGSSENLTFEWNVGFRVGFEYDSNIRGLITGIYFTHINSKAHLSKSLLPEQFADWKLNYNVLDLLLGSSFCLNSNISLVPVGGLRTVWIDQSLHAQVTGEFQRDSVFSDIVGTRDDSVDFWGIGPEVGIKAEWRWNGCFSLFGGIGGGILYGEFKSRFADTEIIGDSDSSFNDCHKFWTCQPVIDAELGLRWRFNLCGPMLFLDLAWEHHRYVNFNHLGAGDLCLDGLTFGARIEF